ncbi:MAG: hypothetical protein ANABAC_3434 [Anaerolineae bacterium]|nr:MAG: hypothetical protein ANABAC_3434 [Anaerolineae bacterium]
MVGQLPLKPKTECCVNRVSCSPHPLYVLSDEIGLQRLLRHRYLLYYNASSRKFM